MNKILEKYKEAVVQITSPFSFGSGFIVSGWDLIITNYHVVKGNSDVVISGKNFAKIAAEVLYTDSLLDIAFLKKPDYIQGEFPFLASTDIKIGERVLTIGHPMHLKYTATAGIISNNNREYNGIRLFQIDAPLNPGNSGGPLINEKAEVAGLNTLTIKDADNIGFSVPYFYIKESLELYNAYFGDRALRCSSCRKVQTVRDLNNGYCKNCGHKFLKEEYNPEKYKPEGIVKKIEDVIADSGYNPELSRSGPFFWEIDKDNLPVKIIFLNNKRLLIFDIEVCIIPEDNIAEFYEFVLQQNNLLKNLIFSLKNNEILLSFIIFEDDFNQSLCTLLLKQLIEKGKHYKELLLERFMAKPISSSQ